MNFTFPFFITVQSSFFVMAKEMYSMNVVESFQCVRITRACSCSHNCTYLRNKARVIVFVAE